jgi:hypothetical protein
MILKIFRYHLNANLFSIYAVSLAIIATLELVPLVVVVVECPEGPCHH